MGRAVNRSKNAVKTKDARRTELDAAPPEGFGPLPRSSPFVERAGPLFCRRDAGSGLLVLGLRVLDYHCNAGGTAHGGLLGTLADVALGYATAFSREPPVPMTTVSLRLDFTGPVHLGDWVEAHTRVHKVGQRLAFADARVSVGDTPVGCASAVFQIHPG